MGSADKLETPKKLLPSTSMAAAPKVREMKDTGFKRPAKLQRKLNEIKENPTFAVEDHPKKKRRVSLDEDQGEEQAPLHSGGGGYTRSLAEETVDGDYYPSTVFIGGLADGIEDRDLEQAFARFGPIVAIRLIRGKNFGFIKFKTVEACDAAIQGMNGELLNSVRIRVDRAKVPSTTKGPPSNWQRRSWESRSFDAYGDDYYHKTGAGGDAIEYSYGRDRDAPYGLPSLRGESTPMPFPATPMPYSAPTPVQPTLPGLYGVSTTGAPLREDAAGSDVGEGDDPSNEGRKVLQYDDL